MYIFNRIFNNLINKICWLILITIVALTFFFFGLWHADAATVHYVMDQYETSDAFYPYDCTSSSSCSTTIGTKAMLVTNDYYSKTIYATTSNVTLDSNGLNIAYALNQVLEPGYMYSVRTLICHNSSSGMAGVSYSGLTAGSAFNSSMNYSSTTHGNFTASNVVMEGGLTSMSQYASYCSVYNSIISPKTEGGWFSLRITRSSSLSTPFYMVGYQISNLGNYDPSLESSITQAIQNSAIQTQEDIQELNNKISDMTEQQTQTNEKLDDLNDKQQETNDLITNDDTDGASSTGNSFFEDFNTTDNGGISSIITMPLRLINGLLEGNNTCPTLKMTIFEKEVEVPGGCLLWSNANDSVVSIWRTIICGISSYFILISLFKDIEKLKNPNNSEVSTLDL